MAWRDRTLAVTDAERQQAWSFWYATIATAAATLGLALLLRIAVSERSVLATISIRAAAVSALVIVVITAVRLLRRDVPFDFGGAVASRIPYFRRLPSLLVGGVYTPRPDTDRVDGRFDGLAVRIAIWSSRTGHPAEDVLTYRLLVPHPWRAQVRRSRTQPTPRWTGSALPPGDPALLGAVDAFFADLHARELALLPGGLQVKLPANVAALSLDHQRRVLERLRDLARLVAASAPDAPVSVEVSAAPRDAAASCPYCRDPVDDPVGEACPACGAPQHEACMLEHGGCTILGCQDGPERVRAR